MQHLISATVGSFGVSKPYPNPGVFDIERGPTSILSCLGGSKREDGHRETRVSKEKDRGTERYGVVWWKKENASEAPWGQCCGKAFRNDKRQQ
jgi:hypothetical protein